MHGRVAPVALRPEAELLLWAGRCCEQNERASQIRSLLQGSIDWDYVLRITEHNRMTPLLYTSLNAACPELVPETVLDPLRKEFHENSLRNLLLTRELLEILKLLDSHGIPALPYKGPTLATSFYGNLALRSFGDLDILVHKHDVSRLKQLMTTRGYRADPDLTGKEEAAYLNSDREYRFLREDNGVYVEIHWQLLPHHSRFGLDTRFLWDRAVSASLAGATIKTLPPEELFLVLCVHGGDHHAWSRLRWICDIGRIIVATNGLDWDRALRQADRLGRKRTVFLGLYLAEVLLGAGVPDELSRRVRNDSAVSGLAGLVVGRLFREGFGLPGFSEWLHYVKSMDGRRDRNITPLDRVRHFTRYLRAIITPEPADRAMFPALPVQLSFVHYFSRPFRIFREQGTTLFRRLR